ncbi:MAG: thioredoxin [Propionibacteriaceae bacterium]|jgi:thioredoxin 1|nr:thioredoxin [Propionibacteriaceae bacterium]
MSHVVTVTDATFETEVLKADLPVLVDYWADWCGPCKQLSPAIEDLAKTYDGKVKFCKIDTNENLGVASSQGIRTLPTLQIYHQGVVVNALVGPAATKAKVRQALEDM